MSAARSPAALDSGHVDRLIAQALQAGRIVRASEAAWRAKLAADPKAETELASLAAFPELAERNLAESAPDSAATAAMFPGLR